jgi:S1-C subfamily serine protease
MSAKMKSIVLLVVVVFSFALWGVAAAQENTEGERPYLGIQLENLDNSAIIRDVVVDSAAAVAGLEEGDVITAINGTEVSSAREIAELIAALNPGDTATIDFTRDDEVNSVEVTLGSAPARPNANMPFMFQQGGDVSISYDAVNQSWLIQDLGEESPLYEAGLRAGDTITTINGEQYDPMSLREFLADQSENVTVTIERDGESQDIEVPATAVAILGFGGFRFGEGRGMPFGDGRGTPFGGRPFDEGRGMPLDPFGMMGGQGRLGVAFVTLDEAAAEEQGVDVTEGAFVTEVLPGSPAETAGLQADDVITAVNGEAVDAEHTLRDRLVAYEPDDTITLDVLRAGESLQIEVTLEQPDFASGMMPFFNLEIPNLPAAPETPAQPNL